MTIQVTQDPTVQENVEVLQDKQIVQNVKSAVNQCDLCGIPIAQELVRIKNLVSSLGISQVIQDSILNCKNSIQYQNLVQIVEKWVNTDIIPTTADLLKLFGSVLLAITNDILEIEKIEFCRFKYIPKASKSERNAGCEELEYTRHADRNKIDGVGGDNPRNRTNTSKQNFHPTVKPLKLMEYLCTLTKTPTGGIVFDPFAGSGTTGMAAKKTGRDFILIEREKNYCEIAEKRINSIIKSLF